MPQEKKNTFPFPRTAIAATLALLSVPTVADDLVLEEVIVTAQKRTESVQDIAATVNVLTGQDIDKFAAFDFNSIQQQTAGLTLSQPNARNASLVIGSGNFWEPIYTPTNAIYVRSASLADAPGVALFIAGVPD